MSKNDKNGDMEKKVIKSIAGLHLAFLLGWGLFRITNLSEDDASKYAEKYLESLESNHDLNKKIDSLIEEFTIKEGSTRIGDDFEEYLGISLAPSKKYRLNNVANELDTVKNQLDYTTKSHFAFETWLTEASLLKEASEIVTENIMDDNCLDYDSFLSFEYGKDYGWIVANGSLSFEYGKAYGRIAAFGYYQVFDRMLNGYLSSYEVLDRRSTNFDNANEYENIINGVLKSCLCDFVLDEDSNHVKVVIPNEVKELVKK